MSELFLEVVSFCLLTFIMRWLRERQVQFDVLFELTLFLGLPGLFQVQYELADLLFFFLCDLSIKSKSIHTDYKLSLIKTEILSLRFLDLALLSLEFLFHVFELFLLSAGVNLFIIGLLEFGLFFFHLLLEIMKYFSIVFDLDSVFVEEFFF